MVLDGDVRSVSRQRKAAPRATRVAEAAAIEAARVTPASLGLMRYVPGDRNPLAGGARNRATGPVHDTCGACLDGFVGVIEPSNVPCWPPAATCDNGIIDREKDERLQNVACCRVLAPPSRPARRLPGRPTPPIPCSTLTEPRSTDARSGWVGKFPKSYDQNGHVGRDYHCGQNGHFARHVNFGPDGHFDPNLHFGRNDHFDHNALEISKW